MGLSKAVWSLQFGQIKACGMGGQRKKAGQGTGFLAERI
jgi:hypothetical protein